MVVPWWLQHNLYYFRIAEIFQKIYFSLKSYFLGEKFNNILEKNLELNFFGKY
jgi:hypothetical protein